MAIHLAGLCIQDLLHHLIGDIGTVTLGFVCHIDLHIGNGICIEGHGHSDRRCGVDAGSSGAVGACGIDTGSSAGSGAARSCAVAAAGQQACGSCTQGSSAQEVATGNLFAHNSSPCLFFFLRVIRVWQQSPQTLLPDKQSLHVRAARRSRVILTKISQEFV